MAGEVTFHQLRIFATVAELESVRLAATRLCLSQSAVSAALSTLQRELAVTLVRPRGRGLELTAAGRCYAGYSRQLLGLAEEARLSTADDGNARSSAPLRLAVVASMGEDLVPRILRGFRGHYPGVRLQLETGSRDRVWAMLSEYVVDVAIGGRPPSHFDFVIQAVCPNEMVAVASPDLLPCGPPATLPWIWREEGSASRDLTAELISELGAAEPDITLGCHSALVAGAVAGLGVALVSRDAVWRELVEGDLVVLSVPRTPLDLPHHLVTRRAPGPAVRQFVGYLLSQRRAGFGSFSRTTGVQAAVQ